MTGALGMRAAAALVTAGLVLQGLVWLLVVPPFRGLDEFDHAFRASAVAYGEIVAPPSAATRGTGAVVHPAADVVEAARAECLTFRYTRVADCVAQDPPRDGLVAMPSGAGRYSPVYYLLTGWPGRLLDGAAGLVAQRLVSLALSALLVGAALALLHRWPRPSLALQAAVVAVTPIAALSLAVLAPNGLEMAAALAWWAALLTLARHRRFRSDGRAGNRLAWTTLVVSGVLLATTRALGPLWLAVSVAVVALGVAVTPGGLTRPVRLPRPSRAAIRAAVTIGLAVAAAAGWTLSQRTLVIGTEPDTASLDLLGGVVNTTITIPRTLLEMVSANPARGKIPPALTVAGWLLAAVLLVLRCLRGARRPDRRAVVLLAVLVVAVPWGIQVATYTTFGDAWQGRYALPIAFGVPLLAAAIAPLRGRTDRAVAVIDAVAIAVAVGVAQGVVVATALDKLTSSSPSISAGWWPPSVPGLWAVFAGSVICTGVGLVLAAVRDGGARGLRLPDAPAADRRPAPLSQEPV